MTISAIAKSPLQQQVLEGGSIWRLVLSAPKGNIIDSAMLAALIAAFEKASSDRQLKAVLIEGEGSHFSFGASVEEHLPGKVEWLLPDFHRLFRAILGSRIVLLAAIRGQCLGGGLELASICHRVFASPDARLGQPEIQLGVFAPVASALLAERIGRARAEDLCLTGRVVSAEEGHRLGLVDEISLDPSEAALSYAKKSFSGLSASSLRLAVQASRLGFSRRFLSDLEEIERLYLGKLMLTRDALEGLRAFVEKRKPSWSHA